MGSGFTPGLKPRPPKEKTFSASYKAVLISPRLRHGGRGCGGRLKTISLGASDAYTSHAPFGQGKSRFLAPAKRTGRKTRASLGMTSWDSTCYEVADGGGGIAVTFECDYHLNVHGLPRHSAAAVAAHVEAFSRFQ
jgi:hypothetical protein